jgi:hypothetical protein
MIEAGGLRLVTSRCVKIAGVARPRGVGIDVAGARVIASRTWLARADGVLEKIYKSQTSSRTWTESWAAKKSEKNERHIQGFAAECSRS